MDLRAPKYVLPIALCAAIVLACVAVASAALNDGFETAQPAWTDAGGDARYRIELQERTRSGSHTGDGCEYLQIQFAGQGRGAFLRYALGRAPVINELRASVWLRADRPGAQFMARVVLPRAIDPSTGKPLTTLLTGTTYSDVGRWQHLQLDDLATLLARQAWVLRAQRRAEVDTREAYVDCLLLNVATGAGRLQLWIDDLVVDGVVTADAAATTAMGAERIGAQPVGVNGGAASSIARPAVEFNGSVFLVDGRAFFPHMIEHRGEPLRWLADRGFNTIKLAEPPSAELLVEAQRTGLWLVCPPPASVTEALKSGARAREISSTYDRVLAWNLGEGLATGDLDATRRLSELVRRADPYTSRPTLCAPEAGLFDYSRRIDVLAIGRDVLGTSFELNDYGTWLRERMRLMRPGTPAWVSVQTELAPELRKQFDLLSAGAVKDANIDVDQLRALVYTALAAGARGVCFRSSARLDGDDPTTRSRAAALELLNTELDLLEPWTASGAIVTNISSNNYVPPKPPPPAGTRMGRDKKQLLNPTPPPNPEVNAFVLQTERARLLLPIWVGAGTQFVANQWAGNNLSFVIPGVSEAIDAYEITASALQPPYRRQRVTGGIRVTLDEFGVTDMIVLTQDPLVIGTLTRRASQAGRRSTELTRALGLEKLQLVTQTENSLAATGHTTPKTNQWLLAARTSFERCNQRVAANDLAAAYLEARRALRPLQRLERAEWEEAIKKLGSPLTSPLAASYSTLPEHYRFAGVTGDERWGLNLLPAGDFEDIQAMLSCAWQHLQHPSETIRGEVDLSPAVHRSGRTSLRLSAVATNDSESAGLVEQPPVWVTSAPVNVRAGQWVRIRGWVMIPRAITGSLDGLMIFDSQTGEPLAERIGQAETWREFSMIRAMPHNGPMTVTFSLTGLGEAWIEDVMIEPLLPPETNRSLELRRRNMPSETVEPAVRQARGSNGQRR